MSIIHDNSSGSGFCAVSPNPELKQRWRTAARDARVSAALPVDGPAALLREPRRLGFNDGMLRPPSAYRAGVRSREVRTAASGRAPLRGTVRVAVVLIEFPDKSFGASTARFEELFFSTGSLATGSVAEYYRDVTGGLVEITGQVIGPLSMPQPLSWYANGNFGIGNPSGEARANIMAQDAAKAADPLLDLTPYDNDGDGYVDAFIVVHAGRGGEESGDSGDIWSHKWVLPAEYQADQTKVYSYLTIPEDAKLGVSAHELGHLLFGFPDLYDTDYTSEGVGNWCLMSGGSWNGGGDTPAHPSAWCKVQQGWVTVDNITSDLSLSIPAVESVRTVQRLWTGGQAGPEYFLLENRQRIGYDAELPGDGLLVWHIDETKEDNTDENHYLVALLQADGLRELELDTNRGDGGDPFPGWSNNSALTGSSTPSTHSYAGQDSGVVVEAISDSASTMTAKVSVSGTVTLPGEGDSDVEKLAADLKDVKARLTALQQAVASAGSALSGVSIAGASAWSRRSRT